VKDFADPLRTLDRLPFEVVQGEIDGRLNPMAASRVPVTGPYLRHQDQLFWARIKRLADEIVGNDGPVELGIIDMVDPGSYCIAKNVECGLTAAGRPESAAPRQLYGTQAQSVNSMAGQWTPIVAHLFTRRRPSYSGVLHCKSSRGEVPQA